MKNKVNIVVNSSDQVMINFNKEFLFELLEKSEDFRQAMKPAVKELMLSDEKLRMLEEDTVVGQTQMDLTFDEVVEETFRRR